MKSMPLFPEQASSMAQNVDLLFGYVLAVSVFFSVLIFVLVFIFAIKYRRKSESEVPKPHHGDMRLEVLWILIPLAFVMTFFWWGADVFFRMSRPPKGAMEIYVTGKQWMWKMQHPEGRREINELHVPVGVPIKLTMTSEDVIHSFYVPAFRIKMDVLPGRYTQAWFTATKPGSYHLFCAEYCGTKHSGMTGNIVVMTAADYEEWLAGSASAAAAASTVAGGAGAADSMAQQGRQVFQRMGCVQCHAPNATVKAPILEGAFGKPVLLEGGKSAVIDEAYVRESILKPQAKIVQGYQPVMPTFEGIITESQIMQIIEYVKSISGTPENGAGTQQ